MKGHLSLPEGLGVSMDNVVSSHNDGRASRGKEKVVKRGGHYNSVMFST